jgi:hypothetical protein
VRLTPGRVAPARFRRGYLIRSKAASGRPKGLAALPALRATLERTQRRP